MSLDIGGRPATDWASGEVSPPENVNELIKKNGSNGVIVSGVISWVLIHRNESAKNI